VLGLNASIIINLLSLLATVSALFFKKKCLFFYTVHQFGFDVVLIIRTFLL